MRVALCLLLASAAAGNSVTQLRADVSAQVGQPVRLNCRYSTTYTYYALGWYQQRPGQGPVLLLYRNQRGIEYKPGAEASRFSSELRADTSSFTLALDSAQRADAALYFCALWDATVEWGTAETRALLFGRGTQLTVEPKNQATSPPSVFVVKSRAPKNDKVAAACLAKGFYPKEVTITMNPGTEVVYDSKEGVLSPDGKYSAVQVVKVGPEEAVKCTVIHASQNFSAEDSPSAPAAPTHLPAASPGFCESSTSSSTAEEPDLEKVNMLSLTVLGLRVLMAKSIAFNVLMTAKLFI